MSDEMVAGAKHKEVTCDLCFKKFLTLFKSTHGYWHCEKCTEWERKDEAKREYPPWLDELIDKQFKRGKTLVIYRYLPESSSVINLHAYDHRDMKTKRLFKVRNHCYFPDCIVPIKKMAYGLEVDMEFEEKRIFMRYVEEVEML